MIQVDKYSTIHEVPDTWDSLIGDNLYLSKKFLSFMESVDQCGQTYYMLYDDGVLDSVFMTHHDFKVVDDPSLIENLKQAYLDVVPDGKFIAPKHGEWMSL